MKIGVLFSGGKDSTLAAWMAKTEGYDLSCLITIESLNENSFMFHTPSISKVRKQADKMNLPLIVIKTDGEKEVELEDLKLAIKKAKVDFDIEGIVTGAVESVYQSSRIQKICNELEIECFNPLWQKDQIEILEELVKENFNVIVVGVFAYPFDEKMLGRKIDEGFVLEMKKMKKEFEINPAGEGGEFESFVLDCPLFSSELEIKSHEDIGEKNSWRRELEF